MRKEAMEKKREWYYGEKHLVPIGEGTSTIGENDIAGMKVNIHNPYEASYMLKHPSDIPFVTAPLTAISATFIRYDWSTFSPQNIFHQHDNSPFLLHGTFSLLGGAEGGLIGFGLGIGGTIGLTLWRRWTPDTGQKKQNP